MSETYEIEKGDTLSSIAQRYGMTWKELYEYKGGTKKANHERLRSGDENVIYPGEIIRVPEDRTPQAEPNPAKPGEQRRNVYRPISDEESPADAYVMHMRWLRWEGGAHFTERHIYRILLTGFEVDKANLEGVHRRTIDSVVQDYKEAKKELEFVSKPKWYDFDWPNYVVGHENGFAHVPTEAPDDDWKGFQKKARENLGTPKRLGLPIENQSVRQDVREGNDPKKFIAEYGVRIGVNDKKYSFGFPGIIGGASQTGSKSHNKELSQRRAFSVKEYLLVNHDIEGVYVGTAKGKGENHPYIDAVGRGLEDIELAINRYAFFVMTYSYKVILILNENDLTERLVKKIDKIDENIEDKDEKKSRFEYALGEYVTGRHAIGQVLDDVDWEPKKNYPHKKVKGEPLSMWTILSNNGFLGDNDEISRNKSYPKNPSYRLRVAEENRRDIMMQLQKAWSFTETNRREGWEDICRKCGNNKDIARSLCLTRVEEEDYKELINEFEPLGGQFMPASIAVDLESLGHFEDIRPHFFWFSLDYARKANDILDGRTGYRIYIPWILPVRAE